MNFGQRVPWYPPPAGFMYPEQLMPMERVRGMVAPSSKIECEVGKYLQECGTTYRRFYGMFSFNILPFLFKTTAFLNQFHPLFNEQVFLPVAVLLK